jgi:hypothetical protein
MAFSLQCRVLKDLTVRSAVQRFWSFASSTAGPVRPVCLDAAAGIVIRYRRGFRQWEKGGTEVPKRSQECNGWKRLKTMKVDAEVLKARPGEMYIIWFNDIFIYYDIYIYILWFIIIYLMIVPCRTCSASNRKAAQVSGCYLASRWARASEGLGPSRQKGVVNCRICGICWICWHVLPKV